MSKIYQAASRLLYLLFVTLLPFLSIAQAPTITFQPEMTGFTAPVDIVNAGDGSNRLFVVEQGGTIRVRNGATVSQFANFGPTGANIISTSSERGLLSMVFHPDYNGTANRYFFIYYTDLNGDIAVSRYQTMAGNPDSVDLTSATKILTVPHPGQSNHNGGKLNFGPDGYLYFALGDGGGGNDAPNNAQNGSVLLGKMLRIDINQTSAAYGNYAVPSDNPYVGVPGIDERIWAIGLRNPFRWSFDRENGNMWIGDVGQGAWEEIDYRPAGSTGHVNYGWRCYEGYESTPGVPDCTPVDYVPPVRTYPNPAASSSAVTGGYVYRGSEFPNFRGYYIATDVYSGDLYFLWPNSGGGLDSSVQASSVSFIVGFGEGEDGTLYAVSQGTSTVYKLIATGGVVLPVGLLNFTGTANRGYNDLKWSTSFEQNTSKFYVEYSKDASLFTRIGSVTATGNAVGSNYNFRHYTTSETDVFYRLAIEDINGSVSYSSVVRIAGIRKNGFQVYPTLVNRGVINIDLNGSVLNSLKIINTNGMLVYKKDIRNASNTITINLPQLAKGIYMVELIGDRIIQTERIVVQ